MKEKSFYVANQTNDYHPKIVAYYYKEWHDFQMPFHTHEAIEIMYVISGECHVGFRDDMIPLKKGQFVMIDSYVKHRLLVDEYQSIRMLNVEFTLQHKQGVFPSIKEIAQEDKNLQSLLNDEQSFIVLKDTEGLYHTLKSLVLELSEKDGKTIIQSLISQLLIKIARISEQSKKRPVLETDIYIREVINYIHHHYDCDLKVIDLASIVYLHPNYLQRIFKETMKCTIMEYVTKIRIDKAKMLLAKTEIPITEISDFIGINSRQYFSYLFKKTTGHTPKKYRKEEQKITKFNLQI